jgi:uncharacterized protein (DUF302 family)
VQHVKVELGQSFERARQAFESIVPQFDAGIIVLLRNGEVERVSQELERGPELAIFQSRDHGSLLQIAGLARKVLQYDVGNPLTASKMTRHQLAAAMYAPFRIVLYENEQGHAVFEYDKPSTLFGQFGDERVTMVALELDAAIVRALQCVADGSLT